MYLKFFSVYLIAVNVALFCIFGADKAAAKAHRRRVPERTLLSLAVIGGSAGGLLGMLAFRHKTRKPAFSLGLPVILAVQLALAFFLLQKA